MALMTQIRNNLAKAFAVFAALFIVYIVLDWGMDLPQLRPGFTGDVVGEVNGKKITWREFSELLRREVENYRAQSGSEPDDDVERMLRDQVWNAFVQEALVEKEIARLGIETSDQEIIEIVHGPNPPEFLVRNFRDSLGEFNRAAYDRAIADPQNRAAWVEVEKALRQQRRQEKLQSLLLASVRVSEGEVKQRFLDRNTTMEAEYVLFDPNRFYHDSLVTVTDDDLLRYYRANQEEFKVRAARKFKYVQFPITPSREDSLEVLNEMHRILEQARMGSDFLELARTYSEVPVSEAFFKHGELSREKEGPVFSARKGEIVGPVLDYDGYHLIKVLDERRGSQEYVRASHILLRAVEGPDSVQKIQKARELLQEIRAGADFATLAREHSEDIGSAAQGGDLGWTAKGGWVKAFEDAAFRARVGEVVGPVRSEFGWHIIKVTGRDNRELELAAITLRIRPSPQSTDAAWKKAEDFSYLARSEGFEKAAEFSGYQVLETSEFTRGSTVPGFGFNETLSNFAFREKVGKVSDPISVRGGVVVAKVSDARQEGVQPLENVRSTVQSRVLREKKLQKLRSEVETFRNSLETGTSLLDAARGMENVSAQRTGPFKPGESVPTVGRDLTFIGTAMRLKPGEVSNPVEGIRGLYIIRLLSRTEADSAKFAEERTRLREEILQEKRNQFFSQWLTKLREKAKIEDNRDRFFR